MTYISRRRFLIGAGATLVAATVKLNGPETNIHTLYADGIADDTDAVQAVLDGLPVKIHGKSKLVAVRAHAITGGKYRSTRTIRLTRKGIEITDAHFMFDHPDTCLRIEQGSESFVQGGIFERVFDGTPNEGAAGIRYTTIST